MNKDRIFKLAKGMRGRAKNVLRIARQAVEKKLLDQYRQRKLLKRNKRKEWNQAINAGAREYHMTYSEMIHGLKLSNVDLDRKSLANLATWEPFSFKSVVLLAHRALDRKQNSSNSTTTSTMETRNRAWEEREQ